MAESEARRHGPLSPDGERGLHYNGSDTAYHWFTAPAELGRSARTFKVRIQQALKTRRYPQSEGEF